MHKYLDSIVRSGAVIFTQDLEHIVVVQNKYLYDEQFIESWGLPKGGLKVGEKYSDCAQREVYEETGLNIRIEQQNPTIKIRNTHYFPVILEMTHDKLRKHIYIHDKVEIHKVDVKSIRDMCRETDKLNYELKMLVGSYLHRAKKNAKYAVLQHTKKSKHSTACRNHRKVTRSCKVLYRAPKHKKSPWASCTRRRNRLKHHAL